MPFVEAPPLPEFLATQLPFERRALELENGEDAGRRLHFLADGPEDGRPVLLLHGNPTWSFLWRKVIAELKGSGLRVLAPDLLGLGLSTKLPALEDHTVARHADAIADLVKALALTSYTLVAQEWGGPSGAAPAARAPERVSGRVLANTAVTVPPKPRGTAFHKFARVPLLSDLAFRVFGFPQRGFLHRVQGDPSSLRGEVVQAYRWPLRRLRDRIAPLALARMVPDSNEHPSIPELRLGEAWFREFEGPVSFVWGTKDPILGSTLRHHEKAHPDAEVTRTEAGHFLQEEVPGALAAAIVRLFGTTTRLA